MANITVHDIKATLKEVNPRNDLDKLNLTGEEIAKLESQGYLISADKKYYLPEIIRTAFGFRYEKGARPKVLSLLAG